MSALRSAVAVALSSGKAAMTPAGNRTALLARATAASLVAPARGVHSQDITKNMQYISNERVQLSADPETMRLNVQLDKPLCVMMNWLLARHKHVMKYATLYLEQGFDVLSVSCTPWQLMWPVKGTQLVARDLLRFMTNNEQYRPLMLHGFSVGGYLWGEVCAHATADKERYQPVLDRVLAQVWDSAADISEISIGVPAAVFPRNRIMQNTLRAYMEYHLKTFNESATSHYARSSQLFHLNMCKAPALFLLSRTDPVGAERSNRAVHDHWREIGIECTWKVFDRSPHVQHYIRHPREYVAALYAHLDAANLLAQPEKMRVRL